MNGQSQLFAVPVDESKLGSNQRAVLARIDRFGAIGIREAGRIVYRARGVDPDHIERDWLAREGRRVLVSLRKRGLVVCARPSNRWIRKPAHAPFGLKADLIGPCFVRAVVALLGQKRSDRARTKHAADIPALCELSRVPTGPASPHPVLPARSRRRLNGPLTFRATQRGGGAPTMEPTSDGAA